MLLTTGAVNVPANVPSFCEVRVATLAAQRLPPCGPTKISTLAPPGTQLVPVMLTVLPLFAVAGMVMLGVACVNSVKLLLETMPPEGAPGPSPQMGYVPAASEVGQVKGMSTLPVASTCPDAPEIPVALVQFFGAVPMLSCTVVLGTQWLPETTMVAPAGPLAGEGTLIVRAGPLPPMPVCGDKADANAGEVVTKAPMMAPHSNTNKRVRTSQLLIATVHIFSPSVSSPHPIVKIYRGNGGLTDVLLTARHKKSAELSHKKITDLQHAGKCDNPNELSGVHPGVR